MSSQVAGAPAPDLAASLEILGDRLPSMDPDLLSWLLDAEPLEHAHDLGVLDQTSEELRSCRSDTTTSVDGSSRASSIAPACQLGSAGQLSCMATEAGAMGPAQPQQQPTDAGLLADLLPPTNGGQPLQLSSLWHQLRGAHEPTAADGSAVTAPAAGGGSLTADMLVQSALPPSEVPVGGVEAVPKVEGMAPASLAPPVLAAAQASKGGSNSKRFRTRPKEVIATLEAELEQKLAQLQLLRDENEALQLRSSALQAVVSSSEVQLEVLQAYGPPVFDASHPLVAVEPCAHAGAARPAAPPLPSASSALAQLHQQPQLHLVKGMTAPQIKASWKEFMAEASQALLNYEAEELMRQAPGPGARNDANARMTCSGASSTRLSQLAPRPNQPEQVAAALAKCRGPAERRLVELVMSYGVLFKNIVLLNPAAFLPVYCTNLSTGEEAVPPEAHWGSVLDQAALDPEQIQDMLACYQLLQVGFRRVMAERARLQQALTELLGAHSIDSFRTMPQLSSRHQAMHEVLDALRANLRRQFSLQQLSGECVWSRMTMVQAIRAVVHSWPYIPDTMELLAVLAQRRSASQPLPLAPEAAAPPAPGGTQPRQGALVTDMWGAPSPALQASLGRAAASTPFM